MRTVIFTTENHPYANKIIKKLLQIKSLRILCIVESTVLYPNESKIGGLIKYIKVSGVEYVFLQILKVSIIRVIRKLHGTDPKEKRVAIIKESNVNSSSFQKKIRAKKPDLFISVFFNQIFKHTILSIPNITTINIHPALLPEYRGISPTFWVLANNEPTTGITVHTINDLQIDKGDVIYQKKVRISTHDTEHSLYLKCINTILPDLEYVVDTIKTTKGKIQRHKDARSYYSLPTKEAMDRFKKQGRKLYNLKELLLNER